MNQGLTPSEQEIVNKESKKKSHAYDYSDHRTTYKEGFQEGVEFALQEMVKGRMIKFVEWVCKEHAIVGKNQWRVSFSAEPSLTTEQLYDKYQEHLKQ